MATMTESLPYRHRIASLCSRETEKKEKFSGTEARSLPSFVEASGKELGEDLVSRRRLVCTSGDPVEQAGTPALTSSSTESCNKEISRGYEN